MRWILRDAIVLIMLWSTLPSWAVEHPGVLPENSECSSCHLKKVSGKSVHSVVSSSCTVCHLTQTRGDMTTLKLLMPKEEICSACHETSIALRRHLPSVASAKKTCLDCHDAHSSNQRMLLRNIAELSPESQK